MIQHYYLSDSTMAGRQYDIVLFGATGYTGKLTALYMAKALPTDIKWAIAGRSHTKLEAIAAQCKKVNPNRIQPRKIFFSLFYAPSPIQVLLTDNKSAQVIEVCNLDEAECNDLARKATIIVTTIGPYAIYGETMFKACAENGTHYLDCTGEVPWVQKMIKKYEKTAQNTGAIMIPQTGVESTPSDMITFALVSLLRERLSTATGNVILSVHELV